MTRSSFFTVAIWSIMGLLTVSAGCGLAPEPIQCPDGNSIVRKATIRTTTADVILRSGNAYVLDKVSGALYPVIKTNAAAQRELDEAFALLGRQDIHPGHGNGDIEGALVICIPSGELGLAITNWTISNISEFSDADRDVLIDSAMSAQNSMLQTKRNQENRP